MSFLHFSLEKIKVNESTLPLLANAFFICFISVGQRLFCIRWPTFIFFLLKAKQKEENLPATFIFFLLKAKQMEENLPVNFKTLHYLTLLSNLKKQESIVLQLINNIGCVN
jgi:hypothetical protein